mmetsp:Transcript_9752/g.14971  ORF Transcript_9752/g.14971 Transcript_9752/m.14971 type:complete len:382 (+) Transcript_9752:68-1213(+)
MKISKLAIAAILVEASMSFQLVQRSPIGWVSPKSSSSFGRTSVFANPNDVLDVEFEPVGESSTVATESPSKSSSSSSSSSADPFSSSASEEAPKTLLDISLESDPDMTKLRIPFVDQSGRNFIDCKIAFMVELDGSNYAIGVPFEHSAGISFQKKDGTVTYMSPDDDENEELMQIMAAQLQQEFGEDVSLKRTPRVLTIAGDLDKHTKGWHEKMFETVDTEGLLDDAGESTDSFLEFMRQELGDDEVDKVMQSDDSPEVDEDMAKLFDVAGFGTQEDDTEGVQKMLENMFTEDPSEAFDALGRDRSKDGVALKLVGFNFKDGKSYSLVQMLTPCTLVAKQISEEDDDDMRFELLTPEEDKIVLPRLETLCEKELKEAGLTF